MNTKIPFTKDILFQKKVCEITSISLEHEINVEDGVLKGNFIVSGDFKSHEVSINKEPFSYVLPFEIELASDIDTNTIEFMIDDFTYEIVEDTTLRVNIDFNIVADKKEVEEESLFQDASELFVDDDDKRDDTTNEIISDETIEEKKEPEVIKEELESETKAVIESTLVEEDKELVDRAEPQVQISTLENEKTEKIEKISEDTIINSVKNADDEFTTYHIHMVSDGETVETICTMYNSNMNILGEYNDLNDLNSGDKIIIPDKNE